MTDSPTTYMGNTFILDSAANSTTGGTTSNIFVDGYSQISFNTPPGVQVKAERKGDVPYASKPLPPKIYFKYVKSKLSDVEIADIKPRLAKLKGMAQDAEVVGQVGLYEAVLNQMAFMIREQAAAVAGFGTFVYMKDIERFRNKVEGRVAELCMLKEFPRVIPVEVRKKLEEVQEKNLFDEYLVLHTNLTKEKAKPAADQIKEKDPILFGRFSLAGDNRLFYITDWIDEYCDLTFSEFSRILEGVDEEYKPSAIEEPTDDEIKAIVEEVRRRNENIRRTTVSNFRRLEDEERNAEKVLAKKEEPTPKKPWWKFW